MDQPKPGPRPTLLTPPDAQTDTSRLQAQELLVQARVASELKRLHEQETAALRETQEKISASSRDDDADGKSDVDRLSRQAVAKEIETLRRKLEARGSGLRALPESVETARSQVVRCLRENDRRPLDCWQEVERFKGEVRKLEKSWVEKVAG